MTTITQQQQQTPEKKIKEKKNWGVVGGGRGVPFFFRVCTEKRNE
jgi:hypothetical protein